MAGISTFAEAPRSTVNIGHIAQYWLVKQSRLSVFSLTEAQFQRVLELADTKP